MDVNSELKDAQLEILDADNAYSGNKKGLIWFNRTANKIKAIYNSAVQILATEEYVDDEISDAISTSESALVADGLVTDEQSATPATPASDKRRIYAKADGIYDQDDTGTEKRLAYATSLIKAVPQNTFSPVVGGTPATISQLTTNFSTVAGRTYFVCLTWDTCNFTAGDSYVALRVDASTKVISTGAFGITPMRTVIFPFVASSTGTSQLTVDARNINGSNFIAFAKEA